MPSNKLKEIKISIEVGQVAGCHKTKPWVCNIRTQEYYKLGVHNVMCAMINCLILCKLQVEHIVASQLSISWGRHERARELPLLRESAQ